MNEYPWYGKIKPGDKLQQGEIIENLISPMILQFEKEHINSQAPIRRDLEEYNVIILTQSCELENPKPDLRQVLSCAVYDFELGLEMNPELKSSKMKDDLSNGNLPALHLLPPSSIPGMEQKPRVVYFRHIITFPLSYLEETVKESLNRLLLLPPYREHLAQAFARYFMRVGWPKTFNLRKYLISGS